MPLSIDSALALPPEVAAPQSFERGISPSERQKFAAALARVEESEVARSVAPQLVASVRTRLSTSEAAGALRGAWAKTIGQDPSDETLAILVAQWSHETGRGASMLNYNFGGIKGTGPSGMSAVYGTREGWGSTEVKIQDRFRAYGSADEGARDYVSLLARRYPDAVQAAERGDAVGFVQSLKARGYFTGNEADYIKSVTSLSKQALASGLDAPFEAERAREPSLAALLPSADTALVRAPLASSSAPPSLVSPAAPSPREALPLAAFDSRAFADEVNRAALLMSALRIGERREERS